MIEKDILLFVREIQKERSLSKKKKMKKQLGDIITVYKIINKL